MRDAGGRRGDDASTWPRRTRRHQELHAGYRVAGSGDPAHVKCLHAHLAFAMGEGGSPVGDWIIARAPTSAGRSAAAWPASSRATA